MFADFGNKIVLKLGIGQSVASAINIFNSLTSNIINI